MNSKANLVCIINDVERINLHSSSLFEIDNITRLFKDEEDFIQNSSSKDKINDYIKNKNITPFSIKIELLYIDSRDKAEVLKVLYADRKINMASYHNNHQENEIEVGRKLIWSSKDNLFLKMIIDSPIMGDTLSNLILIKDNEEIISIKKNNIEPIIRDNSYYISICDIFKYKLNCQKLSNLRSLFEDSLEMWKKDILNLPLDLRYYYAREIRMIKKEYLKMLTTNMKVNNLVIKNIRLKKINLIKLNISFKIKV